jgi:DNA-binding MarR family transcriptional regulator
MNPRKPRIPSEDRTPLAQLSEAALHRIVGYQLAQAAIVTDQVFDEGVGGAGGLRRLEFTILALTRGNPGVTARQLARALAVTPPNVAVWLERLEARGLIERERSTQDARMQHLRTTREGERQADAATRRLLQGEEQALQSLSVAERAMLVELLHKVALARKRAEP